MTKLFLKQKEIDASNGNLNHQDTHICENQDDILIHATKLSHTFALSQFMTQHNYEDLMLKIPVLDSSRSPALRGSSTLLGYPVIFS